MFVDGMCPSFVILGYGLSVDDGLYLFSNDEVVCVVVTSCYVGSLFGWCGDGSLRWGLWE